MYSLESNKLAYTAGFIEADGCFHFHDSISVRITNKNIPLLLLFKEWWGGSICAKGTPVNCYDWNIHGPAAFSFINKIMPYLLMKREEAEILIEFHKTTGVRGRKIPDEIKNLRKSLKIRMKELRSVRNNCFLDKEGVK